MRIKAIITGATGMVGKGVLLECLDSDNIESVLVIGRSSVGMEHPKLKEIIHKDFFDISPIQNELAGYNACYFCLGVSSIGKSEEEYSKLTYDLTTGFAEKLIRVNKDITFCYVSGTGTDGSEKGKVMWARVKGKTENKIMSMPFADFYMFRPGFIYPERGIKTKTTVYKIFMPVIKLLYPLLKAVAPKYITTTTAVGKAMISVIIHGYSKKHLESEDINSLALKI